MEPSELVNILTGVIAVSIVILAIRIFRGDIGDNKGGLVFAIVILGVVVYFIHSETGMRVIEHVIGSMSPPSPE
ncbi:MAG: hypothetical protein QNJ04_05475 [Desulfobacterales bacterium]|nr:hypothetical protein [Desulfobacterales bacterium]